MILFILFIIKIYIYHKITKNIHRHSCSYNNRSNIYHRYGNNICEAFLWDSSKLGKAKSGLKLNCMLRFYIFAYSFKNIMKCNTNCCDFYPMLHLVPSLRRWVIFLFLNSNSCSPFPRQSPSSSSPPPPHTFSLSSLFCFWANGFYSYTFILIYFWSGRWIHLRRGSSPRSW